MSIITVENLGKKYIIGHDRRAGTAYRYQSLRDTLARTARGIYQRLRHPLSPNAEKTEIEEFWALREISFTVEPGDRVGIIGRNGAGKSTLLKILSRITEPTTGRIEISGRVASLLEVGTGFHPELTGRENIFLNGAILGMTRVEIKKKFDEIVAFAEVEKFLDTPVKRYSSGMYVRLAFAVAAHLDPEILIVDEVLSVGDASFQKKCLGRMEDVSKEGRTVLFVSHNMGTIETLTNRCVVLERGSIIFTGPTDKGIHEYFSLTRSSSAESLATVPRSGNGKIRLTDCFFTDSENRRTTTAISGDWLSLVFEYRTRERLDPEETSFGFSIDDQRGNRIFVGYSDYMGQTMKTIANHGSCRFTFEKLPLSGGRYFVGARVLYRGLEADWPKGVVAALDVLPGDYYRTGRDFHSGQGIVLFDGTWQ